MMMANKCWIWAGTIKNDYGYVWFEGKHHRAHRVIYEALVGPIPEGLSLDHLCRVKRCINPDHLEPVTHTENVRRGNSGKWQRERTHCPRGHAYTSDNIRWTTNPNGNKSRGCKTCVNKAKKEKRYADKLLREKQALST